MSAGTGGEGSSRRSANSSVKDLDTVEEETVDGPKLVGDNYLYRSRK